MIKEVPKNVCKRFPGGYVRCSVQHQCTMCDLWIELRRRALVKNADLALFNWRDVKPLTEKGGGLDFTRKYLILKPEAMKRKDIKPVLQNQIFMAENGPGMLPIHVTGEIDGYIYITGQPVTFYRNDFYGVISYSAAERFDMLFYADVKEKV